MQEIIQQARRYLAGYYINAMHIDERTVIGVMHSTFPGGWPMWIADQAESPEECVAAYAAMVQHFGLDFVNRVHWCP